MIKAISCIAILNLVLFACDCKNKNNNLTIAKEGDNFISNNDIKNEQTIEFPILNQRKTDGVVWEDLIEKYIFFAAFEPLEYSFKNEAGSSLYIEKYNLSENDIQIIGSWYQPVFADFYKNEHNDDGPGIGISFLPNRKLVIFQNGYNRQDQDYYLIGNWKIIENKIYCNIEYRVKGYKPIEIEKLNFNNKFVEIFTLETYVLAYVNRKPFEFNNFGEEIKNYLLINNNDQYRYRTLQDEMGNYWNYLDEKYELGYFLLNNKIETKEDAFELIKLIRDFRKEKTF
jgi:hypothetical protein